VEKPRTGCAANHAIKHATPRKNEVLETKQIERVHTVHRLCQSVSLAESSSLGRLANLFVLVVEKPAAAHFS
jgi:hypothetical protein